MHQRHWALAALAVTLILWSSAFVAIRVAVAELGPAALTLARLLVASAALLAVVPVLGIRLPTLSDAARLVACGFTGMLAYQLLLNAGERTVETGTASLLVKTGPIIAALLAWLLLASRPTGTAWIGMTLGFAGAAVIAVTGDGRIHLSVDSLLIMGAAACQATFFVLQKPLLQRYTAFEVTCYATWTGTFLALPATGQLVGGLPQANSSAIVSVVFLGAGSSALGFATWAYALARLPVAVAANTLYLTPPLAIAIGWILLGETLALTGVLGGIVIVAGVVISHRTGRREHPDARRVPWRVTRHPISPGGLHSTPESAKTGVGTPDR